MMACCSTFERVAERQFNQRKAAEELRRYRQKGSGQTTRLLQDALAKSGALSGLLLDVGSGVGSLTFGLLEQGVTRAVAVDASSAYLEAAREEAERRRCTGVIEFVVARSSTLCEGPRSPWSTVRALSVRIDRVRRLVLTIIVSLLTLSASGFVSIIRAEPCTAIETDGGNDGACPPMCVTCGCCGQAVEPVPPAAMTSPHSPIIDIVRALPELPTIDPRDILHVPKLRLT
jgi:Methyltransferase domain